MLLRYAILGLLEGQELHGYRIKSAFEERVGPSWPLNFGQIYQTLKDLRRPVPQLARDLQDRLGEHHVGGEDAEHGAYDLDGDIGRRDEHNEPTLHGSLIDCGLGGAYP